MKTIEMTGRETAILSKGEIWAMPDNIADQIIRRGRGKIVEEKDKDKKSQSQNRKRGD
jgi:hypothetical protein